jgi:hypothetical protein
LSPTTLLLIPLDLVTSDAMDQEEESCYSRWIRRK